MRRLVACLLISVAAPASATSIQKVELPDLVARAKSIVAGTVVSVEERAEPPVPGAAPKPYTFVTLSVEERWKGSSTTKTHVIRLLGGAAGGKRLVIPGIPRFTVGERVVLFDREDGTGCPLVGLGQGVIRLKRSTAGTEELLQDATPIRALEGGTFVLGEAPAVAPPPVATKGRVRSEPAPPPRPTLVDLRAAVGAELSPDRTLKRLLLLGALALAPATASAFRSLPCADGGGIARYETVELPRIGVDTRSDAWDAEVRAAIAIWNDVDGALPVLLEGDKGSGCASDDGGQFRVTFDGGECGGLPPEAAAWLQMEYSDTEPCTVVESDVVFNDSTGILWRELLVRSVALHELGHFFLLAHSWDRITVMGYLSYDVPPPTFLFADDRAARREFHPDGTTAPADLQLHGYHLLELPIPDVESLGWDDMAYCKTSGRLVGCGNAVTGGTVAVNLTVENAGATAIGAPVAVQLLLQDHQTGAQFVIGEVSWPSFDEHTVWSGELEGDLGPEIETGMYDLIVRFDPATLPPGDPSPERHEWRLTRQVLVNLGGGSRPPPEVHLDPDASAPGCGCSGPAAGTSWVAFLALAPLLRLVRALRRAWARADG